MPTVSAHFCSLQRRSAGQEWSQNAKLSLNCPSFSDLTIVASELTSLSASWLYMSPIWHIGEVSMKRWGLALQSRTISVLVSVSQFHLDTTGTANTTDSQWLAVQLINFNDLSAYATSPLRNFCSHLRWTQNEANCIMHISTGTVVYQPVLKQHHLFKQYVWSISYLVKPIHLQNDSKNETTEQVTA